MADTSYDLVVIGAGPGGYHAAIRAAQLGLRTAVVEKDDGNGIGGLGGVCLNWGCIPSKSLLKNAELVSQLKNAGEWGLSFDNFNADMGKAVDRSRKVSATLTRGIGFLLRKNNIALFRGKGMLRSSTLVEVEGGPTLTANNILIATGARPRGLPNLEIDGETIITSREALELRDQPSAIGIVGASAIGVEFAYYFNAYGVEVMLFEVLPHLVPKEDEDISLELERAFKKQGIKFATSAMVKSVDTSGPRPVINYEAGGPEQQFECDKVLLGVGVQPNSDGMGLEEQGVENDRGFIQVDEPDAHECDRCVRRRGCYRQAAACARGVHAGRYCGRDHRGAFSQWRSPTTQTCPAARTACRRSPASASPRRRRLSQGIDVKIGRFLFRGAGKAIAIGDYEGFVKVIADAETGEVVGTHMIGPDVTELVGEVGMLRLLEGTNLELGALTHAHPTLSEALKEAGLAVDGEAVHA